MGGSALFLLFGCASSFVQGQPPTPIELSDRWVASEESAVGVIAVDTASVTLLEPGIYQVWLHTNYATPREILGDRVIAERSFADYDCRRRLVRLHRFQLFDTDGRKPVNSEYSDVSEAQFRAVEPESLGELRYGIACRIGRQLYGK
jgi:surface-adhesin protein E